MPIKVCHLLFYYRLKIKTYKLIKSATGLPSPKHILTYMCNGQASPLATTSKFWKYATPLINGKKDKGNSYCLPSVTKISHLLRCLL